MSLAYPYNSLQGHGIVLGVNRFTGNVGAFNTFPEEREGQQLRIEVCVIWWCVKYDINDAFETIPGDGTLAALLLP